jgi:hypothetical protein
MNEPLDPEYWQNQLEVPVADVLARVEPPRFLASWVEELSPACRRILAPELGIDRVTPAPALRKAALRFRSTLVPLVLVDAAMAGKRTSAIEEVARALLGEQDLEDARSGSRLDRRALGWAMYLRSPANLLRVFHIDRIHRRGVARLALAERPLAPVTASSDTLSATRVAAVLADYQSDCHLSGVDPRPETLMTGDSCVVFFRWPLKNAFVVRGRDNVFGYEREWVVLAFSRDLWRVRIASDAGDAPARIAERIATAIFGYPVRYVNESVATPLETADRFIVSLLGDAGEMLLVEAELRMDGCGAAPLLRVHNPEDRSIAPELRRLQTALGEDVTRVRRVGALKVVAFGKRVRMVFEPSPDGVVVRYTDQVLAPHQREAFERQMRDSFGITVLSTEKRHAA